MVMEKFSQRQSSLQQFWKWRIDLFERSDKEEVRKLTQDIIDMQFAIDDDITREGIIAREIGKTPWKSFCRFGSRRNATGALRLIWIDNKAIPLDAQAMYISDHYCMEILPDELAEFMMSYDRGKAGFERYRELDELEKAFKNLVGFKWNIKFARQIILKKQVEEGYF